jgi:hypothetical protein
MIGNPSGLLMFHFANAILLTMVVSRVILAWYRRAVTRNMRIAGSTSEEQGLRFGQRPEAERSSVAALREREAREPLPVENPPYHRLAVIYGLGGATAGAVMTALSLLAPHNFDISWIRLFAIFYVFCWPIVPTLAFLLVLSRWRIVMVSAAYICVGMLGVITISLVARYGLGQLDSFPLRNAFSFLQLLVVNASPPLLIILATSARGIRSVAPFVLAGLLVFSFGNLVVDYVRAISMDWPAIRSFPLLFSFDSWYMLGAPLIGYACWGALRFLSYRYDAKAFSDAQMLVDAWWLIVCFALSGILALSLGWGGLFGMTAFVAYRAVVAAGLALWPQRDAGLTNRRLLLLRVFGYQRRTERLFDRLAQRWRWTGSVRMVAAADLATRIIGPDDLLSFVAGRLRQLFLRHDRASFQRLDQLDEATDPDGRFRVNKVYCHQDSWQPAVEKLLTTSDCVLMDLRGFSNANQGCLFELQQLVKQDLERRTVFVVDNTTDTVLLKTILSDQARLVRPGTEPPAMPTNPVFAKSGSAADVDRIYRVLDALPVWAV